MKTIIEKAIEGGWRSKKNTEYSYPDNSLEVGVLDPLFWQALGKACGWDNSEVGEIGNYVEDWKTNAIIFHTTNLTEGWESAIKYLEELVK